MHNASWSVHIFIINTVIEGLVTQFTQYLVETLDLLSVQSAQIQFFLEVRIGRKHNV